MSTRQIDGTSLLTVAPLCVKDSGSRCHGVAAALVAVLYSILGVSIKLNGFFKTWLEALVF